LSKIDNTQIIGKVLRHFQELTSTNDFALKCLSQGDAVEGTVISTDYQTAGKGQRGKQWISNRGENLILSIILHPYFVSLQEQFLLTRMTSLAVCRTIQSLSLPVHIKWPNDIMVHGKKVAGILIQNLIQNRGIEASVIGIGLNINQLSFESLPNATSLSLELGSKLDLAQVRNRLLLTLDGYYQGVKMKDQNLREEYRSMLYKLYQRTQFRLPDESIFYGKIHDVTVEGLIEIIRESGVRARFAMKEIKYQ